MHKSTGTVPSYWRARKGRHYEALALAFLQDRGLALVGENYRCRAGEIDLIMRDGATLVFVEVRFRARHGHGSASETVDWRKQRRLWRCAEHYLLRHCRASLPPCRFDVLAIDGPPGGTGIEWLRNVFTPGS